MICCWLLLALCTLISGISLPNQCTNEVASVVVPGEESITLAITQNQPILCWNLMVSQEDLNENKLLIDYEIEDNEYLLEQDAYVSIHVNYDCSNGLCQSFNTTDANFCVDTSGKTTSTSLVPIAASLQKSGEIFIPTETVSIEFSLRWSSSDCESGNGSNAWIAFVVLGIFVALGVPVVMVIFVLVYLKYKKKASSPELEPISSDM